MQESESHLIPNTDEATSSRQPIQFLLYDSAMISTLAKLKANTYNGVQMKVSVA